MGTSSQTGYLRDPASMHAQSPIHHEVAYETGFAIDPEQPPARCIDRRGGLTGHACFSVCTLTYAYTMLSKLNTCRASAKVMQFMHPFLVLNPYQ